LKGSAFANRAVASRRCLAAAIDGRKCKKPNCEVYKTTYSPKKRGITLPVRVGTGFLYGELFLHVLSPVVIKGPYMVFLIKAVFQKAFIECAVGNVKFFSIFKPMKLRSGSRKSMA
jgi:hypothetical protein